MADNIQKPLPAVIGAPGSVQGPPQQLVSASPGGMTAAPPLDSTTTIPAAPAADPASVPARPQEEWYPALLGLAEYFRTLHPAPDYRACIQCLLAVFNLGPTPPARAATHLHLGRILHQHTKNTDLARHHLEQAFKMSQSTPELEGMRPEAACVYAQFLEEQGQKNAAKPILQKGIETSHQAPYWRCRMLFYYAQIIIKEKDYTNPIPLLDEGAQFARRSGSHYTSILFFLSKAMVLVMDKSADSAPLLGMIAKDIESFKGLPSQKEGVRLFQLILDTCYLLQSGQIKTARPSLTNMQQCFKAYTNINADAEQPSTNRLDNFQWLPKEQLSIMVYLVSIMHSMQAGYMEKACKYTNEALLRIEKLKAVDSSPILLAFQLQLLEHIIQCRLVMGRKVTAVQELMQACRVCNTHPKLLQTHRSQLHTLLGLYAMSMNCMDRAEAQFNTALRITQETELWTFINLNLAIIYLRSQREQDLMQLLERIDPSRLQPTSSHGLKASAHYVRGLQCFFQAKYNEAKHYLRETLRMSNAEDQNRLISCTLVLLGHIFLSLGNSGESMNMVTPAMQLATRIPDLHVQLWASALLKDVYRVCGDHVKEQEGVQMHNSFTNMLLEDHFQASSRAEHGLLNWTEGPLPLDVIYPDGEPSAAGAEASGAPGTSSTR